VLSTGSKTVDSQKTCADRSSGAGRCEGALQKYDRDPLLGSLIQGGIQRPATLQMMFGRGMLFRPTVLLRQPPVSTNEFLTPQRVRVRTRREACAKCRPHRVGRRRTTAFGGRGRLLRSLTARLKEESVFVRVSRPGVRGSSRAILLATKHFSCPATGSRKNHPPPHTFRQSATI